MTTRVFSSFSEQSLAFFRHLIETNIGKPGRIYASGRDLKNDGTRSNSINVVFHLHWPDHKGQPKSVGGLLDSYEMAEVASELFRVKSFLERRIGNLLSIIEAKSGCVDVKYKVPDYVDAAEIYDAINALVANRSNFEILLVSGHANGRAITLPTPKI